jgi:N-methylhydantoinase A/oxoprolinase/acetone carboxylase beta subunit
VTDADLVAGRIPPDGLAALGRLDIAAARRALESGGVTAQGVIEVVDHAMVQALRVVSVQRGVDPAGLALVAFGGAGPLHACALADALGMPTVVVPPRAGVLSAVGMLAAPRQVDLVRSWPDPSDHAGADAAAVILAEEAAVAEGAHLEIGLDCRYAGQSHELTVGRVADFEAAHARRNGFRLGDVPIEVVAVRASARWPSPVDVASLAASSGFGPDRKGPVDGPAVLAEPDCTIWVASGWRARGHPSGSWLLTRAG